MKNYLKENNKINILNYPCNLANKNKLFKNQKNLKLFNLKIMMKKTFLGKTPNFFRDLNIDNPTKTTSIL